MSPVTETFIWAHRWHKTLDEHHKNDLLMTLLHTDSSLYILKSSNTLEGLSGTYVDDSIRAGTKTFQKGYETIHERFEMTEDMDLLISFSGF